MKLPVFSLAFLALCLVLAVAGCAAESAPIPPPHHGAMSNLQTPNLQPPTDTAPSPVAATDKVSFVRDVKPVTDKYCAPCHGNGQTVSFTKYKTDAAAHLDKKIFDDAASQVESKKMPPPKNLGQPTDAERASLVKALKGI